MPWLKTNGDSPTSTQSKYGVNPRWMLRLVFEGLLENRYVGDVGDFGKYGLLKALCLPSKVPGGCNLSLGVVWYLVPDESKDGKLTGYLKDSSNNRRLYRICSTNRNKQTGY